MLPTILVLNGSLGGARGNTGQALSPLLRFLEKRARLEVIHLAENREGEMEAALRRADGFVFASGTYWDSWGSPLQRFLEDSTGFEAGDLWLGKPAAVLITMHSVGGKEVLSRLQGVLSTLGVALPPMSGMAYSAAGHFALESDGAKKHGMDADIWQLADLEVMGHNLLEAMNPEGEKRHWKTWPVDTQDPRRPWISS